MLAQRLLLSTTRFGDLVPKIAVFFDTGVGPKRALDSYRRIAAALGADPASILFVSDVLDELSAAADAGCRVALCVRPGNPPLPYEPPGSIPVVRELGKIEV